MDRSKLYDYSDGSRFKNKSAKEIFTEIAVNNVWQEEESVSGFGSALDQTKTIISEIPKVINKLNIKTIFDIPCGDFNWFKEIDLSNNIYIGGDIVQEIVHQNNQKYKSDNISFVDFNLIEDIPNKTDLIFCRDCLVHFSTKDILKALSNVKASKSKYLMMTTFNQEEKYNDIITGGWRTINFEKSPFNLPEPIMIVNENCTEKNGAFSDKSLGVWRIKDLVVK
ncbi:MAG: class I SAM-dependent methyltransferase [Ignavibacteriae bacterium]|nr:class I SAM-dependent methyltransferase [Ignavibacteriota bacterium]MCB9205720.1 class I SAM-dependent methyltransferase [Ignavibacteriales bacterium]MCB9209877.1 class I SAM-dependent methyltransferase [Ignavibacteriales bacterium]MCB9260295.1 class I SAM-dependent methyltransferase [Ignavibacteriales bacterium]